jgi:DNA polymerase-3 subunit delta
MRLRPEQLAPQLAKGLAPIYLIGGDEPLQRTEAVDAVRAAAREQGYAEREVHTVEPGFDWAALELATASLSLFAERRLIELRLPTGRPQRAGGAFLQAYAADPPTDVMLLIETDKLDREALNSAWLRAIDRTGVVLQCRILRPDETRSWIDARMRARSLVPDAQAVELLVERIEGNLLAAAQEIEKLRLLLGEGPVDEQAVLAAVCDSARYSVFDLSDAALAGDRGRSARILEGLRAEGVEPPLVLWALSRELRVVADVAERLARGASEGVALQAVWRNRQSAVRRAVRRRPVGYWREGLRRCARLDRVIKGRAEGSVWDELLQLAFGLAGEPLFLRRESK